MKTKNLISALALTLTIGVGATVYAASSTPATSAAKPSNNQTYSECPRTNLRNITGKRGYDFVVAALKNKFGIKEDEILKAREAGKTLYQFAKEKNISEDKLKEAILEEKNKAIDEAVTKGTISKEEAASLKARIKDNMNNFKGSRGGKDFKNKGNKGNKGNRGKGRGCENCPYPNTSLDTK